DVEIAAVFIGLKIGIVVDLVVGELTVGRKRESDALALAVVKAIENRVSGDFGILPPVQKNSARQVIVFDDQAGVEFVVVAELRSGVEQVVVAEDDILSGLRSSDDEPAVDDYVAFK